MGSPENPPSPSTPIVRAPTAESYRPAFLQSAKPAQQVRSAVDLVRPMIADYEQFKDKAYQDSKGVWTVGYGQTTINGRPVRSGDVTTEEEAQKWMQNRIQSDYKTLMKRKGFAALNPSQQAAILDISYNVGVNFDKKDENGKFVFPSFRAALDDPAKANDFKTLIPQFRKSGGVVVNGLVNRRKDTLKMFNGEINDYVPRSKRSK